MADKNKFFTWHDKNYKKLLIISAVLLLTSFAYLAFFYMQTGDIIRRDISLSGGTSITVNVQTDIDKLEAIMKQKLEDVSVREISDIRTGRQIAFVLESTSSSEETKAALEEYLGFHLTQENSSIEFTGSSLGENFFLQLILAVLYAFLFMGAVVFYIFGSNKKIKFVIIVLVLINPFLFFFLKIMSINYAIIFALISIAICFFFYTYNSVPSIAVIISAIADISMTLSLVNLLGMKVSAAGIVAFLMLIGYSVDTDILLTTKLIKRKENRLNDRLIDAFKTGMTMTLTSIAAVLIALLITSSFSETLSQIFTVLVIGLGFDIINTWITNASLLKWYCEKKNIG